MNTEQTYLADVRVPMPAPINDGSQMVSRVTAMECVNPDQYRDIADVRKQARMRRDQVEQQRQDLKQPSLEAGRRIDAFFKPVIESFDQVIKIAAKKLESYDAQQQAIAEQKRREAEAAARKERERAEAEQRERERIEAEARADQERKAREAAEAKAAQERAAREAAEASARGDKEAAAKAEADALEARNRAVKAKAEQLRAEREAREATAAAEAAQSASIAKIAELENVAETTVADTVQVDGLSRTTTYTWELVDKLKLKPEFLIVDEKAINALVRSSKERATAIVGEGAIKVIKGSATRQRL